jgi:hypothetical protein
VETGVQQTKSKQTVYPMYQTETALIVYGEVAKLQVFTVSGQPLAQSTRSRIVDTVRLTPGLYLVRIEDAQGKVVLQKFLKQ